MADKSSSGSSGAPTQDSTKKVGLIGLVGIVISAMIGGGIYNLPQNMAQDASAGAIIIAWLVTGVGIWFIANTFRILSAARPELTNGLYAYAEKGFGKLVGFFVAYGYWICNCFALVAYSVLIMATLNYFIPDFAGGNNIPSIIGGSIITWIMYFLALRGAKQTSFLNIIGTIGKLVPVIIFILAVATIFKFSVFMDNFWGMKDGVALTLDWANVMPQVQSTMLVTLWLFLGIEGAVVVSGRAKSQTAVRKATMIGFLVTLGLYVIVSLLPLGVDSQEAVGKMADPSMAAIMLQSFGSWGEIMVNAGVIISVLSSWLVWMLMLGEMPFAAAKDGIFPTAFEKENKKSAPSTSLLWTTIVIQVVLVASYFIGSNAWTTTYLPTYFQIVDGLLPEQAGLMTVPMMGGAMLMAVTTGFLASKTGKYKWMPIAGCFVMAGGFFLLSQVSMGTSLVMTGLSLFVLGFGIGLGQQILVLVVQNEFPSEIVGTATAANNFFRQIGSTLGASLVGAVFTSRLATELAKNIPASQHIDVDAITPEFVHSLSATLQEGIKASYNDALIPIFVYLIPLLLVGAIIMMFLKQHPLATKVDHTGTGKASE